MSNCCTASASFGFNGVSNTGYGVDTPVMSLAPFVTVQQAHAGFAVPVGLVHDQDSMFGLVGVLESVSEQY
jgi:hypothetical protein